jgi:hypothetical protein
MSASGRIGLVRVTGPGSSTSLRDFARTGLTAFLTPGFGRREWLVRDIPRNAAANKGDLFYGAD